MGLSFHKLIARSGLIIISFVLVGCVTPLERPTGEKAIVKGTTTYDEVAKMFGRPDEESRNSGGKRLASFFRVRSRPSFSAAMFGRLAKDQGDIETRRLDVLFSPQNIVEQYHYSEFSQRVTSRFTHFETGTPVTDENIARIQKGLTTRAEAIEWFGAPITEGLNFDGLIVLSWFYARMNALGSRDWQRLEMLFNEFGLVQDFHITERQR